jgi:Ca2+-binding EF-hand superfamily protein
MLYTTPQMNKEERLYKAFCLLDDNGDGQIDMQELAAHFGNDKAGRFNHATFTLCILSFVPLFLPSFVPYHTG